jgi:hypothetical protein
MCLTGAISDLAREERISDTSIWEAMTFSENENIRGVTGTKNNSSIIR